MLHKGGRDRHGLAHQDREQAVDFTLRAEVVAGVGALLEADADGNDIAAQGEGVLVRLVVAHVEDPIAVEAIAFGGECVALVGGGIEHQIDHVLAAEDSGMRQVSRGRENAAAGIHVFGGMAIVHGQGELLIFHPDSGYPGERGFEDGFPLRDAGVRWADGSAGFGPMIADDLGQPDSFDTLQAGRRGRGRRSLRKGAPQPGR